MPRPMMTNVMIDRWATDGGSVLEPSVGRKATGWVVDQRLPARQLNWLLQQQADAANWAVRAACFNLNRVNNSVIEDALVYVLRDDGVGFFVGCADDGVSIFVSRDGVYWTAGGTLPASLALEGPSSLVVTCAGQLMALLGGASGIYVSLDGGLSWSAGAAAPWRASGGVGALNFIAAGRTIVWRRSPSATAYSDDISGTGSYSLPSSDIGGAASALVEIVHVIGDTFVAAKENGEIWVTTDGGDNWSQQTSVPAGRGAYALDTDGSRLVVFGFTPGTFRVYYSDDLGVTWTGTSFTQSGYISSPVRDIRCVGNGVWVATGMFQDDVTGTVLPVAVSVDNGVSWRVPGLFVEDPSSFVVGAAAPWVAAGPDRFLLCRKSVGVGLSSLVLP